MSNVNPAEYGVDHILVERIVTLERQLRELKTTSQPISAKSLATERYPAEPIVLGSFNVGAKACKTVICDIALPEDVSTLFNVEVSLFLNGYDGTETYLWPTGSGAKAFSAAANFEANYIVDYRKYKDTPNFKRVLLTAVSHDTVAHDVWFEVSFIVPKVATAEAVGNSNI